MFLHIGGEYLIRESNIIGIFDIENTTISKLTREYLNDKEKEKSIISVSDEMPKTFIVTEEQGKVKVYITSISSKTLEKRNRSGV
ncbi:MAG: DUF370 domain-containing protein [Clostridia bacterium]|nr:DUF370 domain-containing protein [Clostridia bacterium]